MLDINNKLCGKEGDQYARSILMILENEMKEVKEELDSGLDPSKYQRFNQYLTALITSIEVLKAYKSLGQQDEGEVEEDLEGLESNLNWIISQLGSYASFSNNHIDAIKIYEGFVAVHQDNTSIREGLAMTFMFAEEYQKAISIYRKHILISDPHNYGAKAFLGFALWQIGQIEEGERLLKNALINGDEKTQNLSHIYLESIGRQAIEISACI